MEQVAITNKTMELTDCKQDWFFDEKYQCWCLEDILYTPKATTPKFQRLSIFVPGPYMKAGGEIDLEGIVNGFTAKTAPVVYGNNSAGYMQMPHMWLEGPRCNAQNYLQRGFVYVSSGNRGHESKDQNGRRCGKAPANLVDLKTVIRFLRHNAACIPGDMEKLITVGTSAGGAMSALLGVTGNSKNYRRLLEENGAFMEESDAVYASQIYCPIIDLEHADLAYEWLFAADKENEDSPAGPAGVMDGFREALSEKLQDKYVAYFNSLGLKNPETKELLVIEKDKRSGSGYDYLMQKLNEAAAIYLEKLGQGKLPVKCSAEDYIKGNYTYKAPARPPKKEKDHKQLMSGHAGPGVALQDVEGMLMDSPTLGDMVARPPKGVVYQAVVPPMEELAGKDKRGWLSWDNRKAEIRDLDSYVLNHRRRMKPCTSFDILEGNSGENRVFGLPEQEAVHFSVQVAEAIEELKEEFPKEYGMYSKDYEKALGNTELARQMYLVNPMNYIGTEEKADAAQYYRIRVGASDADTSFTIAMALACKLSEAGKAVDYRLVWEQPHCEADYEGELLDWIEKVVRG